MVQRHFFARRGATVLILAFACGAPTAIALPATAAEAVSAADKETARELMNQGLKHLKEERHEKALTAFRGADAIMGLPSTRYAVGRALNALKRLTEAREVLLSVGRMSKPASETAPLKKARRLAAELALEVSKRIPSVTVTVAGSETYQLRIDERTIVTAAAALPQRLDPGTHVIVVQAPGFAETRQTVVVREAETRTVSIQLEKSSGAQASGAAAQPATAPKPTSSSSPPSHGVMAPNTANNEADGHDVEGSSSAPALMIAGYGVMGAAAIVGGITGGLALSESSTLDGLCADNACPPQSESSYDKTLALSHTSTASFVVAGVGAVLGTVGLVMMLSEDDDATGARADAAMRVEPTAKLWLRVGLNGVGIAGRY